MAPSDVWLVIDGYDERQRSEWERTRGLAFFIHIHSMADKKVKSAQALWPMPWDDSTAPREARNPKEVVMAWRKMQEELKAKQGGGNNQDTDSGGPLGA